MPTLQTLQSLTGTDKTFQTVLLTGFGVPAHLGYISGRFYSCVSGASAAAAALNNTSLLLIPFFVWKNITPTAIGVVVTVTGAGSSVKCGLWGHNIATSRPSGLMLPGSGSNTAIDTSSGTGLKGNNTTIALQAGVPYWFGSAFTGTVPTVIGLGGIAQTCLETFTGKSAANTTTITGFTTAFTFSSDITQLDLTGAALGDSGSSGIPVGTIQV